jgi:hypothetical protein
MTTLHSRDTVVMMMVDVIDASAHRLQLYSIGLIKFRIFGQYSEALDFSHIAIQM